MSTGATGRHDAHSGCTRAQVQTLMLRFWGGGADKNRFHTRSCSFPSPALRLNTSEEAGHPQLRNPSALDVASELPVYRVPWLSDGHGW